MVLGVATNQKDFLHEFDKILLLKCAPSIFLSRIDQRTDNDFGKDESAKEVLLGWYQDYEKEMLGLGAIPIDAGQPLEKVVEDVVREIDGPHA